MNATRKSPRITLVGAGPGDPELITLKGLRALRCADVVLYDALVGKPLLDEAPTHALKVYVGKRAGKHSLHQHEINHLLVDMARRHGHVVRLKGGDPFVFGRGFEELAFAVQEGIPVAVVPGVSSANALPALLDVPLTHRGLSRSFWVLTATTSDDHLCEDLSIAAQSEATLVILMGMGKLEQICRILAREGRSHTPAMVIQHGSLPNQRSVVATVATLPEQVRQAGLGTPAIIVVGEVVALSATLGQHASIRQLQTSIYNPQP